MKVPEGIKKCVAFIGFNMADGSFKLAGTVCFVSNDINQYSYGYFVTAKHVIQGIKGKGIAEAVIRINLHSNYIKLLHLITEINGWIYHEDETVDLAVFPTGKINGMDHLFYPVSNSMTSSVIKTYEIDVGDEVFITGLFRHHHGNERNIPIVRIGNICAIATPSELYKYTGIKKRG